MTRRAGITFISGDTYVTFENDVSGKKAAGLVQVAFNLPPGFWTPGPLCAALNDDRDGPGQRPCCYLFCNDKYVAYNWESKKCDKDDPRPISDWNLPSEFREGVQGAANGRGKRAPPHTTSRKAYFWVGSHWAEYDWAYGQVSNTGNMRGDFWHLNTEFGGEGRCGVLVDDGAACYITSGRKVVRYSWASLKAEGPNDIWFLPEGLKDGVIAAMEGTLITASETHDAPPDLLSSHGKKPPYGLADHLDLLVKCTQDLEKANRRLAEFDQQIVQYAALTRALHGFVICVLMNDELIENNPDKSGVLVTLSEKARDLQRIAYNQICDPDLRIFDGRLPRLEEQRRAAHALFPLVFDKTFAQDVEAFVAATDDGEWAAGVAQIMADAKAELANSHLEPQLGDAVIRALEGDTTTVTGKLLSWLKQEGKDALKLEGKAAKFVAKSMSAARGSDSLIAACMTIWGLRKMTAIGTGFTTAIVKANRDEYVDYLFWFMCAKFTPNTAHIAQTAEGIKEATALRAEGIKKATAFQDALTAHDFTDAKKKIGDAFSPTGNKWKGFGLVFKFGELLANLFKALDTKKDAVDFASSLVGTANDGVKFAAEIKLWMSVKTADAIKDFVKSNASRVAMFTSFCTIVSGGLQYGDAIDKLDAMKAAGGWASIGSGSCLLFSALAPYITFFGGVSVATAGSLFVVGVALGVLAAAINLAAAVTTPDKAGAEKVVDAMIRTLETFHHDALMGNFCANGTATLDFAVKDVRKAFDALPSGRDKWPGVKNSEATRAVLAKLGMRGKLEPILFEPAQSTLPKALGLTVPEDLPDLYRARSFPPK